MSNTPDVIRNAWANGVGVLRDRKRAIEANAKQIQKPNIQSTDRCGGEVLSGDDTAAESMLDSRSHVAAPVAAPECPHDATTLGRRARRAEVSDVVLDIACLIRKMSTDSDHARQGHANDWLL
jgi:hypothetical protein